MKLALIYFTFFLAASKVFAGDFINICDRGVVGSEIAKAVSTNDCSRVSKAAMARLEYLVITNKTIPNLKGGSFVGMNSLKSLFIDSNAIESIEPNAFDGLGNLLVLKLDRNKITKIESSVFQNLNTLQAIDLSYNRLADVEGLPQLLALEELNLESNLLEFLPQLSGAESLRSVNLRGNKITKIQGARLQNLVSLRSMDFESNVVSDIEGSAFSQTSLVKINLRSNQLHQIRRNWFQGLPSLRTLTLDSNQIENVEEASFHGTGALERLELHANPLNEISRRRTGLSSHVHIGGVRIIP